MIDVNPGAIAWHLWRLKINVPVTCERRTNAKAEDPSLRALVLGPERLLIGERCHCALLSLLQEMEGRGLFGGLGQTGTASCAGSAHVTEQPPFDG